MRPLLAAARLAAASCALAAASALAQSRQLWADRPIARPELPPCVDDPWVRAPMDAFVLQRLRDQGVAPAAEAGRAHWLRRASLDLCGLPPTPEEIAAFEQDLGQDAYERQADRLLASVAYGERWAQWWLDLARYADSQGYEKDDLRRSMWRWRDWVIAAFAADMPFDQFTIEQIAGDLLPGASLEQRLATALHRNTMTNTEGGTDDEEFRSAAVVDRVNTTMSVWMGSTFGCAQCHDHKYDPISQREYFELYAFFDQTKDQDRPDDAPTLAAPTPAQQDELARLREESAAVDAAAARLPVGAWAAAQRARVQAFAAAAVALQPWRLLGPVPAADFEAAFAREPDLAALGADDAAEAGRGWVERPDFVDGKVHEWRGESATFYLRRTVECAASVTATLALGSDDAIKAWCNGERVLAKKASRAAAPRQELVDVALRAGRNEIVLAVVNGGGPGGFCFELAPTRLEAQQLQAMAAGDEVTLREAFWLHAEEAATLRARKAELSRELAAIGAPDVPVMEELPAERRRTTRIHLRGSFLSPGDEVQMATPKCWSPMPEDAPRSRLGLARWLVSAGNPRTARVQASRIWEQLFGRGLVSTSEDFGAQGDRPSHPLLLDWLACELRDQGWSWKGLLRQIVLSSTYRQGPVPAAGARERDPDNLLCSRSPRLRLSAEMLRDQALAVSGLLSRKAFGPSVMPEQPEGIWGQIYSGERWTTSAGEDRHRRSLYTLWRRTSPHPTMMVFDAPSREVCAIRRVTTNTPLQALALWNDPQFVECQLALAARVLREAQGDEARLRRLFELCLLRAPTASELQRLLQALAQEREVGRGEAAAWAQLAAVAMSLDEFLVRG